MKYVTIIARVLLGLAFLVFGLNGFFGFLPMPPMEGDAGAFMTLLYTSGWLKVVKSLEVVGGTLVLFNVFPAIGLTLLGPVIVNIVIFHLLLEPSGLPVGLVLLALEVFLIWANRERFAAIFRK